MMITAAEARKISNEYAKKYMEDLENMIEKAAYEGKTRLVLECQDKINDELVDNISMERLKSLAEQLQDNGFSVSLGGSPFKMVVNW